MSGEQKYNFWMTCPKCGKKFSVSYTLVLKYVGRLGDELGKKREKKRKKGNKGESSK